MDQVPLVDEMIEAGNRFVEEFNKTFPGTVAFWLKVRGELVKAAGIQPE